MLKFRLVTSAFLIGTMLLAFPAEAMANRNNLTPAQNMINNRVNNRIGDMSFFGGISEGERLPLTTEILIADTEAQRRSRNRRDTNDFTYSELVFLGGEPELFEGTLRVTRQGGVDVTEPVGNFTVIHQVLSSGATGDGVTIDRLVHFNVNYRLEGSQVIFTYNAIRNNWRDVINVNGSTFTLVPASSHYNISIIQDITPGVSYYRGDISGLLVYTNDADEFIEKSIQGSFHGYRSPWSATETHRLDVTILAGNWGIQYQLRPSITMNKVLQFVQNEPMAISFEGNLREVMVNTVGLRYDIMIAPPFMWDAPTSGSISLNIPNVFEQLPAHDLTFLRGNPAEDDIRRLFSTQVLTGDPRFFQPGHAISRGQFVAAVARAIRLPLEPEPANARQRAALLQPDTSVFYDVPRHRPEYPWIMAAYQAGLAVGRANNMFYFDYPIDRQEAFMIMVRALGLTQMGLNPTPVTSFVDDALVAPWARREVSVAQAIGIAIPDQNGFFHPTRQLTMGEAANILNELIEYMRVGLVSDYADQIVNIVR
ncbi:MAG: S-layer homology domain-containing protein [Defluviitaleaceae bacterium]|nr:S-layer homology domain-containing protein [Defluviitaleaceae bacterium]